MLLFLLVPASALPASAQGESRGDWLWSWFWSTGFGEAAAVDESGVYIVGLDAGIFTDRPRIIVSVLLKVGLDGDPLWSRELHLITTDYHVLAVNASDVYVVGQSNDTTVETRDVILQRYTPDGLPVWTRRFGSELTEVPRDAVADASGVYVVGDGWDQRHFDPAASDSFVSKFDRDGNEVWTTRFSPSRTELSGVGVGSSGIYIVGSQRDRPTVWKLDLDGNLDWVRALERPVQEVADVAVDADTVYVVGTTKGVLAGQSSKGGSDAFLRKYDANGSELWTRQFGAPGFPGPPANDRAKDVAIQPWGIYVAGTISQGTPGPMDAFARRFSVDGVELWGLRYVGASTGRGLAVGPSGFYITGNSHARAYVARFAETPDPPRGVKASPGGGHVGIVWNRPQFDGGLPIAAYRVYRATQPGAFEPLATLGASVFEYLDSDVVSHITYHYAIAAINDVGEGPWSAADGVTLGSPPAVVNPVPPPIDPFLVGAIAILGGVLLLAVHWLRGVGKPGDDRVPSGTAPSRVWGFRLNAMRQGGRSTPR